jgi:hypothetical protein
MIDSEQPVGVRSLGRTLYRWRLEITALHPTGASNGPTEAMNNMIKRVKRVKRAGFLRVAMRKSPLVATKSPRWWPGEVPAPH